MDTKHAKQNQTQVTQLTDLPKPLSDLHKPCESHQVTLRTALLKGYRIIQTYEGLSQIVSLRVCPRSLPSLHCLLRLGQKIARLSKAFRTPLKGP